MGEGAATSARWMLDNVLASDKVLYHGHAVAAVAATDPHIAEDALGLIEVEYEVLEPVLDVIEAMDENAPGAAPDPPHGGSPAGMFDPPGGLGDKPTNVAKHARFEAGDIDAGFADADVIIEREFRTSMAHQGYIEPHNGSAFYNRDGHLTVWTSTQGSFGIRDMVATLMDMPDFERDLRADGDRRRLRREDPRLPRAARGDDVEADRPPGQARHDAPGRARSHWPDLGHRGAREDRREERRHDHGCLCVAGVRGRGLPGLAVHRRGDVRARAVRDRERRRRGLRRRGQQAEGLGLPRPRRAPDRVRRRVRH